MERRELLGAVGTAATVGGALALLGDGQRQVGDGTVSGSTPTGLDRQDLQELRAQYDTVLDAVDDLGLDPEGDAAIDDALRPALTRQSTLVEFPPGEYRFDQGFELRSVTDLGLVGRGDGPGAVRFRTPATDGRYFLRTGGGRNLLIENVTFDYGEGDGSIGLFPVVEDGLAVRDVTFAGFNPTADDGGVDNLAPAVTGPDGVGVVEGLRRTGPTHITTHQRVGNDKNHGCVYVDARHEGTLYVRHSRIENTGTNAIYATHCPGDTRVERCWFGNNNQTSLRLGGNGSHVRDCVFWLHTDHAHPDNVGDFINPHAIVWETGEFGQAGGAIENCRFHWEKGPRESSPVVWVDGSAGRMALRNSLVVSDIDGVRPLRFDTPREPRLGVTPERPWDVTVEDVTVRGRAGGDWAALRIRGRDGSVVRNAYVGLDGDCDGIHVLDAADCRVTDVDVDVGGRVIRTTDAAVDARLAEWDDPAAHGWNGTVTDEGAPYEPPAAPSALRDGGSDQ